MDFFFVDDAGQNKPSRQGMGPLLAVGGIHIGDESVKLFESQVEELCTEYGFPLDEPFKWSPGKDLWMRTNLVGAKRKEFFRRVLETATENDVKAIVIIEDTKYSTTTKGVSPDIDLIQLFLERAHFGLCDKQCHGIVIVAQPPGDKQDEYKFLYKCIETLRFGTKYVVPERIALNVLSTPSKFVRLLQVADLVVSCTTAFVAGEKRYSPPIFDLVKPLLAEDFGRRGGVGLKIHPDFKYGNLYHWLVGDELIKKGNVGHPLPHSSMPYFKFPHEP